MQSIDSVETYEYGVNKDVICKKEEIRCNIIIKNAKMFLQQKTKKKIIQICHKFLTIHI